MASLVCVLSLAVDGCARPVVLQNGIQYPTGRAAALVNDWRAVTALSHGTHVVVTIDPSTPVGGRVQAVDDDRLTLAGATGPSTWDRTAVVRVVKVESMSAIHAKQGLFIGLAVDALLVLSGLQGKVLLLALPYEVGFFSGVGALSGIGESRQTLVYERP